MRGGSIAPTNPPFCSMRRRSLLDVFFSAALRRMRLYRRNAFNCFDFSGTRPFSKFLMHSHRQSTNGPPQVFKYIRLSFSVNRFNRFNSGRICRTRRRLILTRDFAAALSPFILSKRTRTVGRRRGKCARECDTIRRFPVSDLSAGNRAVLSWRL